MFEILSYRKERSTSERSRTKAVTAGELDFSIRLASFGKNLSAAHKTERFSDRCFFIGKAGILRCSGMLPLHPRRSTFTY